MFVMVLKEVEHVAAYLVIGVGRGNEAGLDGIYGSSPFDNTANGIIEFHLVVEIVETACDNIILIDARVLDFGNEDHIGILLLDTSDAIVPELIGHHF